MVAINGGRVLGAREKRGGGEKEREARLRFPADAFFLCIFIALLSVMNNINYIIVLYIMCNS